MNKEHLDNAENLLGQRQPTTNFLDGKYGDVLRQFLTYMDKELHANSAKGDRPGWLSMSKDQAMLEIYYHVSKLQKAVKNNDIDLIREYSADVANMAMMVLDVCGGVLTHEEGNGY